MPADESDGVPVPSALMAATVNVKGRPFVSPPIVCVVEEERNVCDGRVPDPSNGVTTYPVMGRPPFATGATHDTSAAPFPAIAATPVGAAGTVAGVTGGLGAE